MYTQTKMEACRSISIRSLLLLVLILIILTNSAESQLSNNYYDASCPAVESVVRSTVQSHYNSDPTIAPGLLRLHFHDCFVQVRSLFVFMHLLAVTLIKNFIGSKGEFRIHV